MIGVLGFLLATSATRIAPASLWVDGYYPAWKQANMPPSEIDFGTVDHLMYFALNPTAAGGLDMTANGITEDGVKQIVSATHNQGKKILITVGGAGSGPVFEQAIAPANRDAFIQNIVSWTATHGFDGVDVDMEPVALQDVPIYQPFIRQLRASLTAQDPKLILTAATNQSEKDVYPPIQNCFDQINVMTYDLSGLWEGYETWYNSNLSNGGRNFKSNGKPLPSVQTIVADWENAGLPAAKLGVGVAFYGDLWHGATGPNQDIAGLKVETMDYCDIMDKYYSPKVYHWDDGAHSPYLSLTDGQKADQLFISYDDEKLCREKVRYVKSNGLGGLIIWQLAGDYRPSLPPGSRNPLLSAIGQALKAH